MDSALALELDVIAAYAKRATGEKYLINPNNGVAEAIAFEMTGAG